MTKNTVDGLRETLRRRGRRIAALKNEIRGIRAAEQQRTEALEQLATTLQNRARYEFDGNSDARFALANASAELAEIINRRRT